METNKFLTFCQDQYPTRILPDVIEFVTNMPSFNTSYKVLNWFNKVFGQLILTQLYLIESLSFILEISLLNHLKTEWAIVKMLMSCSLAEKVETYSMKFITNLGNKTIYWIHYSLNHIEKIKYFVSCKNVIAFANAWFVLLYVTDPP